LGVAALNAVMGTVVAYTLARHVFPGRRFLDALLDLPLAVPGLMTGAALAVLYGPGASPWLTVAGRPWFFSRAGVLLALAFVSLPLVARAVQPLLVAADPDDEDAAASMGASPWDVFRRVLLPRLAPGIAAGALMTFSRALGELAVVGLVAGNVPFRTQTAALYALGEMESENQLGASAMGVLMIAASFFLTLAVNALRARFEERGR
jgi:sulfate transport system permease protein